MQTDPFLLPTRERLMHPGTEAAQVQILHRPVLAQHLKAGAAAVAAAAAAAGGGRGGAITARKAANQRKDSHGSTAVATAAGGGPTPAADTQEYEELPPMEAHTEVYPLAALQPGAILCAYVL